jgi:hypothetical protein
MTAVIPVACLILAAAGLRLFLGTPKRRARARSALRAFWGTLVSRSDPGQRYAGRAGEAEAAAARYRADEDQALAVGANMPEATWQEFRRWQDEMWPDGWHFLELESEGSDG